MTRRATEARRYPSAVAVERAIDLLSVLAQRGDAGVSELAQEIGLGGGATHRLLVALRHKGVVDQDPSTGRYSLAWFLMSLARSLVAKNNLRTLSIPVMAELRDALGETISLFARSGFQRVCIEQLEGTREFHWRAELGKTFPLYAGASGKLILAQFTTDELEQYFKVVTLERLTPHTKVTKHQLDRELAKIRSQGWAISCQDRIPDAGGAAAPIYDHLGTFQAALTIAAPAWRMSEDDFRKSIPALTSAASQVSQLLGFTGDGAHSIS